MQPIQGLRNPADDLLNGRLVGEIIADVGEYRDRWKRHCLIDHRP
jgi:hypothetical protein